MPGAAESAEIVCKSPVAPDRDLCRYQEYSRASAVLVGALVSASPASAWDEPVIPVALEALTSTAMGACGPVCQAAGVPVPGELIAPGGAWGAIWGYPVPGAGAG